VTVKNLDYFLKCSVANIGRWMGWFFLTNMLCQNKRRVEFRHERKIYSKSKEMLIVLICK